MLAYLDVELLARILYAPGRFRDQPTCSWFSSIREPTVPKFQITSHMALSWKFCPRVDPPHDNKISPNETPPRLIPKLEIGNKSSMIMLNFSPSSTFHHTTFSSIYLYQKNKRGHCLATSTAMNRSLFHLSIVVSVSFTTPNFLFKLIQNI